jgi:hypothetical protein
MYNAYLFIPSWDKVRPRADAEPGRPRNRLEIEQYRLEQDRMNSVAYGYEQQVHVINTMRHQHAMNEEQIRRAQIGRQGRLAASLDRMRAAIGSMLISAGERIGRESMRRRKRKLDAERYDNVRHA